MVSSSATVQRTEVTDEQLSTLFWINVLVGAILSVISLGLAPVLVAFYHEPRLWGVTATLAASFLINAAGVQHSGVLQRQMRFTALAVIETLSLLLSVAVGVGMALARCGYWSLVGMTITVPTVSTIGVWLTSKWIPGAPRRGVGIRSMVHFGGTLTLNGLVVYVGYNLEKLLIGRFWGAEAIGIYGRAYQLVNIPTENLNTTVSGVACAVLSRLQGDPKRFQAYFLKGYALVLSLTLPLTVVCALFADDLISVLLGPKWSAAAPIFRLLAPTILIFAMINPFGWLLFALGQVVKSLRIALVMAPLTITGYLIGLAYGPKGVALAYSVTMTLWLVPHILWCVRGTPISFRDILIVVSRPLVSALFAGAALLAVMSLSPHLASPASRLLVGGTVFCAVYVGTLLFVMGQKSFYFDLLRSMLHRSSNAGTAMAAAAGD